MSIQNLSPTAQRLLPLYIGSFLQNVPFWYVIEKLFMTHIGFDTASIGVMVAIMSAVMLLVETPSGILADRWSRKGVILLGTLALLLAGIIGGISYNEPMYIISTVCWGIYAALYSGTFEAVVYDTTVEETGDSKKYTYYLSRLRIIEGAAFIVGALGGGLLASHFGMRETFYISLPFIAISAILIMRFREPKLHKMEVSEPVFRHIRQTFAAVLRNRFLLPIVLSIVGFTVLQDMLLELNQLWFIELDTPVALYGIIGAVIFSTWSLGGLIAGWLSSKKASLAGLLIILSALVALMYVRNYWFILLAQFLFGASLIAFGIILSKKLHDELPSKLRAGSSSVISTLSRTSIIPISLLLTGVANSSSIFSASFILLGIGVIAAGAYVFTVFGKREHVERKV